MSGSRASTTAAFTARDVLLHGERHANVPACRRTRPCMRHRGGHRCDSSDLYAPLNGIWLVVAGDTIWLVQTLRWHREIAFLAVHRALGCERSLRGLREQIAFYRDYPPVHAFKLVRHTFLDVLEVQHHGLKVEAGRGALQPHAPTDEALDVDLAVRGRVTESIEEILHVLLVETQQVQEQRDAALFDPVVELLLSEASALVGIHVDAEPLQFLCVSPLLCV
mmetsp:Transcript_81581/g.230978  ORF Transcript_81581/g.230978 Transcript_81581/m.230978 type:complete len:222 (+) Transcript_81581:155-820(+)